jgi:hypothetical protein
MRKPKTPPALILCCVDYRYIEAIQAFVKRRLGVAAYDLKTDAGGTKALLNGNAAVRAWILSNVKLAYHRHGVRTVVLVHHEDCAAYGGSSAFIPPPVAWPKAGSLRDPDRRCRSATDGGIKDRAKETAFHAQQLALAAALLRASFSRLTVRMFHAYRARQRIVFAETGG